MIRKMPLLSFLMIIIVLIVAGFSGDITEYGGGSPGGYTGSPADAKNCVQCHGGSATTVNGWISSDVPPTGYIPGTSYTMTVTLTGSGKKGFECSPQSPAGALMGSLTAGPSTHLVNGNKAVTQNSSPSSNPYSWSFGWTAPPAGSGPVTFYAAFTVGKTVTKLCTLLVPETITVIEERHSRPMLVAPNPAHDYLSIYFPSEMPGSVKAELFDLSGKAVHLLFQGPLNSSEHLSRLLLPSSLPSGLYFLKLSGDALLEYHKIIVQ
ncbi:MAG TPA: T9SS type A sorting domain-containing protein [Bacteroidales bacterium]|nr:T9SS type A sorting domain-containing protein [Bacteroidales bacterium]HSA43934.1 T9SS type A sorting domain-containing protein [Bacteroidales bacterium]